MNPVADCVLERCTVEVFRKLSIFFDSFLDSSENSIAVIIKVWLASDSSDSAVCMGEQGVKVLAENSNCRQLTL